MAGPVKVHNKSKLPFAIKSSSVDTGYAAEFSASFGGGWDITNYHYDEVGGLEGAPMQGPFTEEHVGGNQHRHQPLNDGNDTQLSRAEIFHLNTQTAGEIRLYNPSFVNTDAPRATMLRGNSAKSPVNIANIATVTGTVKHGNFRHNYEVVQTSGRKLNNRYLKAAGNIQVSAAFSPFITGLIDYKLLDRTTGSTKSIIVERFSAPGDPSVGSRGVLDIEGEEYAPNNALVYRNWVVRQPLQSLLTQHAGEFGQSSFDEDIGDWYTTGAIGAYHKTYRNAYRVPQTGSGRQFATNYDNWYVQHAIPSTDLRYAWITASATTGPRQLFGYQSSGSYTNRGGAYTDIEFVTASLYLTGGVEAEVDHLGISPTLLKRYRHVDEANKLFHRDRWYFDFSSGLEDITSAFTNTPNKTYALDLGPVDKWDKLLTPTSGSGKMSFACWFNVDDAGASGRTLFSFVEDTFLFQVQPGTPFDLYLYAFHDTTDGEYDTAGSLNANNMAALNRWHFVAFTYDLTGGEAPKIYLDGNSGSIDLTELSAPVGNLTKMSGANTILGGRHNRNGNLVDLFSGKLAELSLYDDILTYEEVQHIYNKTKSGFNSPPKSFAEHRIDLDTKQLDVNSSIMDKMISWYSAVPEDVSKPVTINSDDQNGVTRRTGTFLRDMVGNNHGVVGQLTSLQNSVGVEGYSLVNGAFQHANWKTIRGGEHPVARSLREQNTYSVQNNPREVSIPRRRGTRRVVKGRRGEGSVNYVEPPVSNKHRPIRQYFIFKGDDQFAGHEVKHTYANNLGMFANKDLNNALTLKKADEQMLDRFRQLYSDPNVQEENNPFEKHLGYDYTEVIWPKEENTFLAKTRGRTKYIIDQPGFGSDGYDVRLGDARVFWRDDVYDRQRTYGGRNAPKVPADEDGSLEKNEKSYRNSQGIPFVSSSAWNQIQLNSQTSNASFGTWSAETNWTGSFDSTNGDSSVWPFDIIGDRYSQETQRLSSNTIGDRVASRLGGELNYSEFSVFRVGTGSATISTNTQITHQIHHQRVGHLRDDLHDLTDINNSAVTPAKPRVQYCAYLDGWRYDTAGGANEGVTSSLDMGLQWRTAELSGKNPWYDSYEEYAENIRLLGKDMSVLPEFRISEHIPYYVLENGGNFRKANSRTLGLDGSEYTLADVERGLNKRDTSVSDFYKNVVISDSFSFEVGDDVELSSLRLNIKAVKKLLPYNGFYPVLRTVQLAGQLSKSIAPHLYGGFWNNFLDVDFITDAPSEIISGDVKSQTDPGLSGQTVNLTQSIAQYKMHAFLQGFYAPGIMYNSIKSGIAVNWPAHTGSAGINFGSTPNVPDSKTIAIGAGTGTRDLLPFLYTRPNYRFPFESIISPQVAIPRREEVTGRADSSAGFIISGSIFHTWPIQFTSADNDNFMWCVWNHDRDSLYELMANNFFAEVPRFFLKDEKLLSFRSSQVKDWELFDSTKSYYMDVTLRKTDNMVMVESFSGHEQDVGFLGEKQTGRYFGFPLNISASADRKADGAVYDIVASPHAPGYFNDPAYAAYTPPYHEGTARARLKFTPSETRKYTLDEVLSSLEVENLSAVDSVYSGSAAWDEQMVVEACVNYFGKQAEPKVTYDSSQLADSGFRPSAASNEFDAQNQYWVIGTRWESPVLNFSNQEANLEVETYKRPTTTSGSIDNLFELEPVITGSGYGRGMWSGYGEVPGDAEGIYLSLEESFPEIINQTDSTTGSLLAACGFSAGSERVGQLAESKEISETIVLVPFVERQISGVTTEIDGRHMFKIDRDSFNTQFNNYQNGRPAIRVGDLGSEIEIRSTSISRMIDVLQRHVVPPNMNFLEYKDIDPFVMYTHEFTHVLDQQELVDIWQGVMPKIAMNPQLDEVEFEHSTGPYEFFGGKELPENLRFMIFKIKKKAEKNYYAVTADSTDDDRFQFDFQVGRKAPEYSYNWPYDYFSLVELAKVEATVKYRSDNKEEKMVQNNVPAPRSVPKRSRGPSPRTRRRR